jgi:hypothetical protein
LRSPRRRGFPNPSVTQAPESLIFDRNDRFVEKFVQARLLGQLIGALLNERAVRPVQLEL